MKILNFGGATAILEHRGKRMLFDPWLDDGIFHGSWHHFPPAKIGIEHLGHLDYVYISHIHEDHCSAGTIKHINKDAEIILMDRKPNFVLNFLKAHGFEFKKVHLIKPQTPTEIAPGLVVDMVTADPAHELAYMIDSGLILNWDGCVVYNSNDCRPYKEGLEYVKRQYPDIDLALLPYAGGSGYPACYTNLSDEEKLNDATRIFKAGLRDFVHAVEFLQPKHAMPFADQYVVVGSRSHLNKFMAHPPSAGAVKDPMEQAGLGQKLLLLNSGQSFEVESGKKFPDAPFYTHTPEDREKYIEEHKRSKYDHEAFELNPAVSLSRLVTFARARLWAEQKKDNYYPEFTYYLSVNDRKQRFKIDLSREGVEEVAFSAPLTKPCLNMSMDATLLALLLIGHVSWNIADASLFLDYERIPNVYDPKIHAFVNYLKI